MVLVDEANGYIDKTEFTIHIAGSVFFFFFFQCLSIVCCFL